MKSLKNLGIFIGVLLAAVVALTILGYVANVVNYSSPQNGLAFSRNKWRPIEASVVNMDFKNGAYIYQEGQQIIFVDSNGEEFVITSNVDRVTGCQKLDFDGRGESCAFSYVKETTEFHVDIHDTGVFSCNPGKILQNVHNGDQSP